MQVQSSVTKLEGEMRSETKSIRSSLEVTNVAVHGLSERVAKVETRVPTLPPARSASPVPRRYDPEETSPGGGLRIPPEEWKSALAQIDTLTEEREAEKKSAALAQERQATIAEYADSLEKEAKRKRHRMVKIIAALIPVLTALGGWVSHLLRL